MFLKKLWAEGLSGNEIASRIACPSRSAVIGKAHRLGLAKKLSRKSHARPLPAPRRVFVVRERKPTAAEIVKADAEHQATLARMQASPDVARVTNIIDLDD